MKTKVTLVGVASEPQLDEQMQRCSDTIAANVQIEEPQENCTKTMRLALKFYVSSSWVDMYKNVDDTDKGKVRSHILTRWRDGFNAKTKNIEVAQEEVEAIFKTLQQEFPILVEKALNHIRYYKNILSGEVFSDDK